MGNRLSSMEVEPDPEEKPASTVIEKPKKTKRSKTRRKKIAHITNNKTLSNTSGSNTSGSNTSPSSDIDPPVSQSTPLLSPQEILAMTDNGIMMDPHDYSSSSSEVIPPQVGPPQVVPPIKPTGEPRRRNPKRRVPKTDA